MKTYEPKDMRSGLYGPVFPIVTPFNRLNDVDLVSLNNYVEFLIECGAQTIMTTVGTSRFNLLSHEEIIILNSEVVRANKSRSVTIVSGPLNGNLQANIEHAVKAQEIGANAFIAYYPERWYDDESVFLFYNEICKAVSISVFIHEMPLRSGYGGVAQYSLSLLDKLLDIPNLVGMKEECMDGGYAYKIHRKFGKKASIIGAGAMRNFLRDYQAGAKTNLVGLGSFFPKVEIDFHEALKNNNLSLAKKIVQTYEDEYFDFAVELGWHTQLKASMNYFGLLPTHERSPLRELSMEKKEQLIEFFDKKGWSSLSANHETKM